MTSHFAREAHVAESPHKLSLLITIGFRISRLPRSEYSLTSKGRQGALVADKEDWVLEGATEEYLVRSTIYHTHLRYLGLIEYLKAQTGFSFLPLCPMYNLSSLTPP